MVSLELTNQLHQCPWCVGSAIMMCLFGQTLACCVSILPWYTIRFCRARRENFLLLTMWSLLLLTDNGKHWTWSHLSLSFIWGSAYFYKLPSLHRPPPWHTHRPSPLRFDVERTVSDTNKNLCYDVLQYAFLVVLEVMAHSHDMSYACARTANRTKVVLFAGEWLVCSKFEASIKPRSHNTCSFPIFFAVAVLWFCSFISTYSCLSSFPFVLIPLPNRSISSSGRFYSRRKKITSYLEQVTTPWCDEGSSSEIHFYLEVYL